MLRIRDYALIAGAILFLLGIGCLPAPLGMFPKRDLSVFNRMASADVSIHHSFILIASGVAVIAGARLGGVVADRRPKRRKARPNPV